MADPFELRLFFSNRLRGLNPCDDNTEEVVSFALKHRDLDEDLHSCILEQLESENNNINIRANIVYFLEDLVELARREKHYPYLCMIERDFPKIIDYAIPLDGMGIVNVNCVRYILEALHYEHDIFHEGFDKAGHNLAIGQKAETKSFKDLEEHLQRRAVEARPDVPEPFSDNDSEPDMAWMENGTASGFMDMDRESGTANSQGDIPNNWRHNRSPIEGSKTQMGFDTHDIPAPQGSASPMDTTPVPPTPPSLSPQPSAPIESLSAGNGPSLKPVSSAISPLNEADNHQSAGSPMKYSPAIISPAAGAPFQDPTPTSRAELNPVPANPTSPKAYTPVQEEDSNIFLQQYFEFVTQRMEQDRERQRRKEDNSGFIKSTGNWDEEIGQIANTGKEYIGDVFEMMEVEHNNWVTATEYE